MPYFNALLQMFVIYCLYYFYIDDFINIIIFVYKVHFSIKHVRCIKKYIKKYYLYYICYQIDSNICIKIEAACVDLPTYIIIKYLKYYKTFRGE